jgi:hypothetical protein
VREPVTKPASINEQRAWTNTNLPKRRLRISQPSAIASFAGLFRRLPEREHLIGPVEIDDLAVLDHP